MSEKMLDGKLAVITGAASGIGLATAKLFAERGADLVLVDISSKVVDIANEIREHINDNKRKICGHIVDVKEKEQVDKLFESIKSKHSKPANLVVNSAAIGQPCKLIDMTEEMFEETVATNLKGTFLVTQSAIRALVHAYPEVQFKNHTESYASIINLSSQSATHGLPNVSHYSASKAGINGFTKSLASEYGQYRIRVNSVLPYFLETPFHDLKDNPSLKEVYLNRVPMKRFGEPEEVANLNLFLASDCSSYISGANIDISGGF